MKSLEELVEEKYNELNENDLYIWQYLFHHRQACQKMSIQRLAQECNVSHTSIIRFAKKIGLDGFSELKVYMKWSIDENNKYNPKLINQTTTEIQQTISSFEHRELEDILELIYQCDRIFVYGTGDVQSNVAREIRREFLPVKKIVHVIDGLSELEVVLRNTTRKDIFILLSFSGDNLEIITLAKALRQMKIQTIGIALDNKNLLYRYSDHFLGFHASRNPTGVTQYEMATAVHYFIIVSMLVVNYIDYLNSKKIKQSIN